MSTTTNLRSRPFGVVLGLATVAYAALASWFYYDGFFRYLDRGVTITRSAMYLPLRPGWVTIMPWSRWAIFGLSVAALGWCAWAFWKGRPLARLASFFTAFGLILPQARLLYSYMVTIKQLSPMAALLVAGAMVVVPVIALGSPGVVRRFQEHEQGLPWARLHYGRIRLIAMGVLMAWTVFLMDGYLAQLDYVPSPTGFYLGWITIGLALTTLVGLLRLRTWALFSGLAAAGLSTAILFIADLDTVAILPSALVLLATLPFLRLFVQRLR